MDDFLIETTSLKRTFHAANWHPDNPVLKPDRDWERAGKSPTAMVFSDGVWWDPAEKQFKMWYMAGYTAATGYATSKDGLHWEKPVFDVRPGTNVVQKDWRDSSTTWLDLDERDPLRHYKLFRIGSGWTYRLYFSGDGIHWGEPVATTVAHGDRSTVFYNPFRKVWVFSIRSDSPFGRARRYFEHTDVLKAAKYQKGEPVWWVGADKLDPPRGDLKVQPQLYNLDAVAYESLLLGLFSIWRGQPADRAKFNEVHVGFSRDGFHWDRPCRRPLVAPSEQFGDWNAFNLQSAGGCCLVVGDQLWFYVSGRSGKPGSTESGICSTGVAMLRRDGFASLDAGQQEGTLTTRPLVFDGKHLFVNAATQGGQLRVELLDRDGKVIEPFTAAECVPMQADSTLHQITWKRGGDLSAWSGKPVRLRFLLNGGRLYSFWISPDATGASHGFVAAGGSGLSGTRDTQGKKAYAEVVAVRSALTCTAAARSSHVCLQNEVLRCGRMRDIVSVSCCPSCAAAAHCNYRSLLHSPSSHCTITLMVFRRVGGGRVPSASRTAPAWPLEASRRHGGLPERPGLRNAFLGLPGPPHAVCPPKVSMSGSLRPSATVCDALREGFDRQVRGRRAPCCGRPFGNGSMGVLSPQSARCRRELGLV